jgi:hypothetical protein
MTHEIGSFICPPYFKVIGATKSKLIIEIKSIVFIALVSIKRRGGNLRIHLRSLLVVDVIHWIL